jgi:hypothetical protein
VSPHEALKRGEQSTPATPPTSGTQNAGEPSANEGGQMGVQGAKPPGGGFGGVSPHETLKRGEQLTPATPPRVGPKTPASPKPTRVGKWGSRGRSPLAGGLGGVPPRNLKKGRAVNPCNPATSGTQNAGEPLAHEGGQMGVQGAKPPGRGCAFLT